MARKIKRVFSILLCTILLVSAFSTNCLAASKTSGKCGKNAKWSYNKKKHTLTLSGKGTIENGWVYDEPDFQYDKKLTVVIKKGITTIGENAFLGDYGGIIIKKLTLPDSLKSIGEGAFAECDLPSTITIPKNVEKIGREAFGWRLKTIKVDKGNKYFCSIDGVLFNKNKTALICCPSGRKGKYSIPEGTKKISKGSFSGCSLTTITIPKSVKTIDDYFFTSELKAIKVDKGNKYFSSKDGVLFTKDGMLLMVCPRNKKGSYSIPDGVTTLGVYSFYGSSIDELTVAASVRVVQTQGVPHSCSSLTFRGGVPLGLSDELSAVGNMSIYFPNAYYNEWYRFHCQVGNSRISWYYY